MLEKVAGMNDIIVRPCTESTAVYRPRKGILTTSALASLSAVAAQAQTAGDEARDSGSTIEEIVVTAQKEFFRPTDASSATKFDLPIFDTPQSISVVTADLIDSARPEDLLQVDKYVAGVYSLGEATTGTAYFGGSGFLNARGFQFDADNGFKINGFSTLGTFYPDLSTVDRIEFVKGPTAVVYGVNNYGGTVNILTKKPPSQFEAQTSLGYGSYDYKRLEVDIGGPVGGDRVRARLAGAAQDRGFIRDGEEMERYAVMPTVTWDITDATSVSATAFIQDERRHFGGTLNLTLDENGNLTVPTNAPRKTFIGLPDYNLGKTEHRQYIGELRHDFANGSAFEAQVGYTDTQNRSRSVYTYNFFGPAAPTTYIYNLNFAKAIESTDAELRFSGEFELFGRRHKFLVNGEHRSIKRDDPRYAYVYLGSTSQLDPDFSAVDVNDPGFESPLAGYIKEDRENYAIGGQVLLNLSDRLSVLVGGRQTWSDISYANIRDVVGEIDPDFAEFEVTADFSVSQFTPRIGLVYNVMDDVNAYVSYSQGFIPQTGATRAGGVIDPETGDQWEVGAKAEFFNGALGLNTAVYLIERDDVQAPDPLNTPGEDFVVAGRSQRHSGVEIEAMGRITDGLNIVANYTYQESRVTRDIDDATIVGNPVSHVPYHLANLFLQYQVLDGPLSGLNASIGYNYYGEYYHREDNEYRFQVPDRYTVDAFLAYEGFERVSLDLAFTNITDEKNIYTAFADRHSSFMFEEPRTLRARIQVRY